MNRIPLAACFVGTLAAGIYGAGCEPSATCIDDGTCTSIDASAADSDDAGGDASDQDASTDPWPLDGGNVDDRSYPSDEESDRVNLATPWDATGGTLSDGGSADGAADGEAGADVFVCDETSDPMTAPCVLSDSFGVFVAPAGAAASAADGKDAGAASDAGDAGDAGATGDGSKIHPYATLGQALSRRGKKTRIYVCNGVYPEQVTVNAPVSVFGGLGCAAGLGGPQWSYVGGVAQVVSPSPDYALTVTGVDAGTVVIADMSFEAPDAVAPGASSIAALIGGSNVNLVRVTLIAGAGADGAAGASGAATPNYAGFAPLGGPQSHSITPLFTSPGAGAANTCIAFGKSAGGNGGLCGSGVATAGTATPQPPVTEPGRDGLPLGSPLPDGGTAASDDPGADGVPGEGGVGSSTQPYGSLSPQGWVASAGGDGAPGAPGQGGSGGTDPFANNCGGAQALSVGGGGGGAGGCGGAGGKGGGGGGASLALASVGATVSLQQCDLRASVGGAGGPGGAGQDGQAGAAGGDLNALNVVHAPGQPGGNGAGGSGGAGGAGGLSVGLLYRGGNVSFDTATMMAIVLGPPGSGGAPGAGGNFTAGPLTTGSNGNDGAAGVSGIAAAFLKVQP